MTERQSDIPERSDQIIIITETSPAKAGAERDEGDAERAWIFGQVEVPIDQVTANWQRTLQQVASLVGEAGPDAVPPGFDLSQFEVSLAVTAEGQLAFIAKAGIQASVKVIFKRP
jgi:hypothetical protein